MKTRSSRFFCSTLMVLLVRMFFLSMNILLEIAIRLLISVSHFPLDVSTLPRYSKLLLCWRTSPSKTISHFGFTLFFENTITLVFFLLINSLVFRFHLLSLQVDIQDCFYFQQVGRCHPRIWCCLPEYLQLYHHRNMSIMSVSEHLLWNIDGQVSWSRFGTVTVTVGLYCNTIKWGQRCTSVGFCLVISKVYKTNQLLIKHVRNILNFKWANIQLLCLCFLQHCRIHHSASLYQLYKMPVNLIYVLRDSQYNGFPLLKVDVSRTVLIKLQMIILLFKLLWIKNIIF